MPNEAELLAEIAALRQELEIERRSRYIPEELLKKAENVAGELRETLRATEEQNHYLVYRLAEEKARAEKAEAAQVEAEMERRKAEAECAALKEQYRLAHIDSMQATAEAADLLREIDDALAVVRAPDSTNDGGRANLADEMRQLSRNFTAATEEAVESHARAERYREALEKIASNSSGGLLDTDEARDRHAMIHVARAALKEEGQ